MSGQKKSGHLSKPQKRRLIELLSTNSRLRSAKFSAEFTCRDAQKEWENIAEELNSLPGIQKTWKMWRKGWQDLFNRAKSKKAAFARASRGTGGGPPPEPLDEFDESVAALINNNSIVGHEDVYESAVVFDFHTDHDYAPPPVEVVFEDITRSGTTSGTMINNIPETMIDNTPGTMNGNTSGTMNDITPGYMNDDIPGSSNDNTPGSMNENTPDTMNNNTRHGTMINNTPYTMDNNTPGTMINGTSRTTSHTSSATSATRSANSNITSGATPRIRPNTNSQNPITRRKVNMKSLLKEKVQLKTKLVEAQITFYKDYIKIQQERNYILKDLTRSNLNNSTIEILDDSLPLMPSFNEH